MPKSGVSNMDNLEAGKQTLKEIVERIGDTPVKEIPNETIRAGKEMIESILEKNGRTRVRTPTRVTFKDELSDAFPVFNDEVDTSFLLELLYFFPIEKTWISTGSYDQYLYDLEKTIIDNYEAGNFQVSFFYAHLIFMSYVYYCIERIYKLYPDRTKDVFYPMNAYRGQDEDGKKLGKPSFDSYKSVYEFSTIPEKDIFKLFHVVGMSDDTIKAFGKYINKRDDFAHATGKGNISEYDFRQNIRTIIGNMKTLRELFLPNLKKLYFDFMIERIDVDYDVVMDNFNDFVFDNELSVADLDYLCHLSIKKIQSSRKKLKEKYQSTRNIHCAFIEYCMENDGIEPPAGYPSLRNEKYLFYRYKDHADDYVESELGISAYRCGKEGGAFPVYECPECGEEQLAYDAESGKFHCFACDVNYTTDDYDFCENCGALKKTGGPVCNECLKAAMEKD